MQADRNFMGRFINQAHRSTYWTQHLCSLAASVANATPLEGKLYPNYPHFLRRSGSIGRASILTKLSEFGTTNKVATREDLLQPLMTLLQAESPLGDPEAFETSLMLGLNAEEHLSLTGMAKTRRSSKELMAAYEAAMLEHEQSIQEVVTEVNAPPRKEDIPEPIPVEEKVDEPEEAGPAPGQTTLF